MLTILLYLITISVISGIYYGYYRFATNIDRQLTHYQNQTNLRK